MSEAVKIEALELAAIIATVQRARRENKRISREVYRWIIDKASSEDLMNWLTENEKIQFGFQPQPTHER